MTGKTVYDFLSAWQTLIAGVLAFSGAWATLAGVRRQVDFAANVEQKRRIDESFAARAVVPMVLSDICRYAYDCIRLLANSIDTHGAGEQYIELKDLPHPPENVGTILKDAIRFSDDPERTLLARLLGDIQVHNARIARARGQATNKHIAAMTREDLIYGSADLIASASDLFDWARVGDNPAIPGTSKAHIRTSLKVAGVPKGRFPKVDELIGDQVQDP